MARERVDEEGFKRLAKYWFRARLMHELLHSLMKEEDWFENIDKIWWEFETFLCHWLSTLFVVVEGFNRLRIKDARVQRLFKEQVGNLKSIRHETYHFVTKVQPAATDMLRHLNWAEELHEALGEHINLIVQRKALVEKLLEKRAKQKS